MKYVFSALLITAGIVLLVVPHELKVRGTGLNYGWFALGIGVISLVADLLRRKPPASPNPPKPAA